MIKLRYIFALLLILGLLSQAGAQVPLWRVDIRRNELNQNTFGPRLANDGTRVFFLQKGQVKTVDAATGKILWAFPLGRGAQLEYGAGVLVAITGEGKIFALEPATGKVRWFRQGAGFGIDTSDKATLYIAETGKLSALNPATGRTRWQKKTSFVGEKVFGVVKDRILVPISVMDTYSDQIEIYNVRTGKRLGKASRKPLAILGGKVFAEDNWFLIDYPDEIYLNVYSLKTGKQLERRTYSVENRVRGQQQQWGSVVAVDPSAIYISGGGNIACFPVSSSKRKGKPDFIRVPHGEVKWVTGPYHGSFVLEWQKSVWVVQRQREKPCSPIQLRSDGYPLASGRVSSVTHIGNTLYVSLKSGAFFAVDLDSHRIVLRLTLPTSTFGTTRIVGTTLVIQAGNRLLAYTLPQLTSP